MSNNLGTHLILTVHGVRTFGRWQDRLELLVRAAAASETEEIEFRHYKYGFFTIFAFLVPFLRTLAVKRFRQSLEATFREDNYCRVDLVAHSFGSYLVAQTLAHKQLSPNVRFNTVIFCSSVLPPEYDLSSLVGPSKLVRRIINECAIKDSVLLLTIFAVGVGMGGRLGLHGFEGPMMRNRYFDFGHSGYFLPSGWGDRDGFMRRWWVPLLLTADTTEPYDERPYTPSVVERFVRTVGENGAFVTVSIYSSLLAVLATSFAYLWLRAESAAQEARNERDKALVTQSRFLADLASQRISNGDAGMGLLLALEALPANEDITRRPYVHEAEIQLYRGLSANRQALLLSGHAGAILACAYNLRSGLIVTVPDGMQSKFLPARVWDATGHQLTALRDANGIRLATFDEQGERVVTASIGSSVRGRGVHEADIAKVWNARTGKVLAELVGHEQPIKSAVFSNDGQKIVTASYDRTAKIWDVTTGINLINLQGHSSILNSARYEKNDERIVTASDDKTARVWDARTGKVLFVLKGHTAQVWDAVFSPDGELILTRSNDGTARLWDSHTGSEHATLEGMVYSDFAAFNSDGTRIIAGTEANSLSVWDTKSGKRSLSIAGHTNRITNARFSADSTLIVSSAWDGTSRIWDARTGKQLSLLVGHAGHVTDATFGSDNSTVITVSRDRTARIWNIKPDLHSRESRDNLGGNRVIARTVTGQRVVTGSKELFPTRLERVTSELWNAVTSERIAILQPINVGSAIFSPDGARLITTGRAFNKENGSAFLWDAGTGRLVAVLNSQTLPISNVRFSADGKYFATTNFENPPRIWNSLNGDLISTLDYRENEVPKGFAFGLVLSHSSELISFSSDNQHFYTNGPNNTVQIWDTRTGLNVRTLKGHDSPVNSVALNSSGSKVVTSSSDSTARIWNAQTGNLLRVLEGHGPPGFAPGDVVSSQGVLRATFSLDGRQILTGGSDKTARLWDVESGRQIGAPMNHRSQVGMVVFLKETSRLLTADAGKSLYLWDAKTGVQVGVYDLPSTFEGLEVHPESGYVRIVAIDSQATRHQFLVYPDTHSIMRAARDATHYCLSPAKRKEAFLEPHVPERCIGRWPYDRAYLGLGVKCSLRRSASAGSLLERNENGEVDRIIKGAAAERYGIQLKDRILSINGQDMHDCTRVNEVIADLKPGYQLPIEILRGRAKMTIKVKLGFRDPAS